MNIDRKQNIKNKNELISILNEYSIPHQNWGKIGNGTKSVNSLWKEISEKESSLVKTKNNKLVRMSESVWISVFNSNGRELHEKKQSKNGKTLKIRNSDHPLSEKKTPKEKTDNAIIRGIYEELNLTRGDYTLHRFRDRENVTQNSRSYPGLQAQYSKIYGEVTIKPNVFKRKQHLKQDEFVTTNKSGGKTIHWAWEKPRSTIKKIPQSFKALDIGLQTNKIPGQSINESNKMWEDFMKQISKNNTSQKMKVLDNTKPVLFIVLGPMGSGKTYIINKLDRFVNQKLKLSKYIANNIVETSFPYKTGIKSILKSVNSNLSFNNYKTSITNQMRGNGSKIYKTVKRKGQLSQVKKTNIINSIRRKENILVESNGRLTSNIYELLETGISNDLKNNNYSLYFFNVFASKSVSYNRGIQREYKAYQNQNIMRLMPQKYKYNKNYNNSLDQIQIKMKEYNNKNSLLKELVKGVYYFDTTSSSRTEKSHERISNLNRFKV